MNKKATKILSIIAVVFAIIFAIAMTAYMFNPRLWGPAIGIISLVSGVITILLYLVIRFALRPKNNIVTEYKPDDAAGDGKEGAAADKTEAAADAESDKPKEDKPGKS
jgi:cbb3-type cytochrome oxidase subunit 3